MMVIKSLSELGRPLQIGDKVKIVDKREGRNWNPDGLMDVYLGTVMTVRDIAGFKGELIFMNEDSTPSGGGWCWAPWMIDGVLLGTYEDILEDPATWPSADMLEDLLT